MDKALQTMIDNMPEKTGKSLEQWKALLAKKSLLKHSESVNFLKKRIWRNTRICKYNCSII